MADDYNPMFADVPADEYNPMYTEAPADATDWSGYGNLTPEQLDTLAKTVAANTGGAAGITGIADFAKKLFLNSNGTVNTGMVGLLGGGLGSLLGMGKTNVQPAGYQGGIPRYTATRQAPGPGQKLSGNVTYTPRAAGGGLRDGGFVIPADVVSHFGNGSSDAGLKLLASKLGASPIRGGGDGMSDSIKTNIDGRTPAKVAHEEAYVSPENVAKLGGGNPDRGAQKLRSMMERIRKARTGSKEQGKQIDPNKFMPGGEVKGYDTGGTTNVGTAAAAGVTGTESNLSNWAGPYVTDMLGKGQALSEMPYEQYQGPLTAGPSALQQKTFAGLGNVNFPGTLGQSFTDQGVAQSYMNPYLKQALQPQLEEMRRQSQVNLQPSLAKLTQAGGFGGGRQAIMESEANRNLLQEQDKLVGQGYATAFDKAQQQFNTEQQQGKTLADLFAQQGQAQRGIESEDVAAQKAQFEEARSNPYKMVQFQQSLLQGLPLAAQSYNVTQPSELQQLLAGIGGGAKLGGFTSADLNTALKNLGITTG